MKKSFKLFAALTPLALILGCNAIGPNPSPPTQTEQSFFDIQTNLVSQLVPVTNHVTVTNAVVVTTTNGINLTNLVTQVIPQVTTVTQQVPAYTMTPNATAKTTAESIGAVTNGFLPGVGSLVSMGLLALLGAWGHLRSYKGGQTLATQQATTNALAQEMETVLEFVKALPNGPTYANAITQYLQSHQLQAGALQQVATVLKTAVSNPNAKASASEVIAAINALPGMTTKLPQPTA